ncbi:MAG TPA: FMN-binding negative transcriptional regulator [Candidatus Baltobacteraceae bacterium]|jgi:transcriptional regulator|nr:FMN-binding negative transcriptional regulator [Candidatus Baltobacteraceae bacterium]
MYVPAHFSVEDRERILDFIRREPFGILVSQVEGLPFATHVPFVPLSGGEPLVLGTHVARANPQWQGVQAGTVLAIFHGPHAHVSAAWYAQPQKTVPTWNYSAVHCYGTARLADRATTLQILERLVARHEGPEGWSFDAADPAAIDRMLPAIVGIEVTVERVQAQFKFSQNRSIEDRHSVIAHLSESDYAPARALAADMSAFYERDGDRRDQ